VKRPLVGRILESTNACDRSFWRCLLLENFPGDRFKNEVIFFLEVCQRRTKIQMLEKITSHRWNKCKEVIMTRKYVDCREFPSDMNCSVAIAADTEEELLDVAVQHAVSVHQHKDSPELRAQIRTMIKSGTPPVSWSPVGMSKPNKVGSETRPRP
jgi:predicted small metal-binding protein